MDNLVIDLLTLKKENETLKSEISDLKSNIQSNPDITPTTDIIPQLLQELAEREKCSSNIIVHGFSESSSSLPAHRISDDSKLLSDYLKPLSVILPDNLKLFRLGRVNERGRRPLKVIFPSKEIAINFLSSYNIGLRSRDSSSPKFPLSNFFFSFLFSFYIL